MSVSLRQIAPDLTRVDLGSITVWFSFETPVAFQTFDGPIEVAQNVWSAKTGRHLNQIDGGLKKGRWPISEFAPMLNREMTKRGL